MHLGIDQAKCARFLGISERTTRRYIRGEIPIPPAHALLLRAMVRLRAKPVVPAWNGNKTKHLLDDTMGAAYG